MAFVFEHAKLAAIAIVVLYLLAMPFIHSRIELTVQDDFEGFPQWKATLAYWMVFAWELTAFFFGVVACLYCAIQNALPADEPRGRK